ncbi:MAG: hypothetical protein VKQ33_05965 [Candidatus Sericytochromatia bacterium]|nr:hypothetical protein [Candidatus Sericytochromatia bacterium]
MATWRPRWPLVIVLAGVLALGCTAAPAPSPGAGKPIRPAARTNRASAGLGATPGAGASAPALGLPGEARVTPAPAGTALPSGPSGLEGGSVAPTATPTPTPRPSPTPRPTPTVGPDGGRTLAGTLESGVIDGPWDLARFQGPEGLAVDASGTVYVADTAAGMLRRVSASGDTLPLAGGGGFGLNDGIALSAGPNTGGASFQGPVGLAVAPDGALLVADTGNHAVRRVQGGRVTTLAGTGSPGWLDGAGRDAQLNGPRGLAVAADGTIFVADTDNHRLRVITPEGGVSTLAGTGSAALLDGEASAAAFNEPVSLVMEASGTLLVLDRGNKAIRRVTRDGAVTTVAGGVLNAQVDGVGSAAGFRAPSAIVEEAPGTFLVADLIPPAVRRLTADGQVTTVKTGPEVVAFASGGGRCYVILLNEPRVRVYELPLGP